MPKPIVENSSDYVTTYRTWFGTFTLMSICYVDHCSSLLHGSSLEAIALATERWKGQKYMERRKSRDAEELTALRERLHDSFERFMVHARFVMC
jgi:hypothetical protein